jgi:autotransporter-associated beta strand protein
LTLSGSSTYSGSTNVSSGTLLVTNTTGSATGSGVVTVASGATLGGTGIITGPVTVNGTVFTGLTNNTSGKSASILTLGSGSTLSGSLLEDLTGPSTSDQLAFTGSSGVTLGGTLTVTNPNSITFAAGQSYDILNYGSNPVSGTFSSVTVPALPATLQWNESALYTSGVISINNSGPANLTWNNAGGTGDGVTWDTVNQNWNNGSAATTFSNTSNTSNGDNVTFNDSNNGNYNVTVTSSGVTPNTITINTAATYNFSGGSIGGGGGLTLSAGTLNVSNTTQNAWGSTTVNGGTLILANNTALPINQTLTIAGGATVKAATTGGPSNVTVLQVGTLNNSGTLDLTNNDLVVRSTAGLSLGQVTAQVAAAYNGGAWNGSSAGGVITSSTAAGDTTYLTALGVATGSAIVGGSIDGVAVSSGDIIVKYTYYGDTNLDGAVDGSDYTNIDNGFNTGLTGWQNGDFNYDGVVDGSDYTLIDNAYNMQGSSLGTNSAELIASATAQIAGGSSAVPEPTTLGLLGIGAAGLLGRRNRRRH